MPGWRIATRPDGQPLSTKQIAIHAALVPGGREGQVVYFAGDCHDPNVAAQPSGGLPGWNNGYLYDVAEQTIAEVVGTVPGFDTFCAGHAVVEGGRILVAGGTSFLWDSVTPATGAPRKSFGGLADAAMYVPGQGWTKVPSMSVQRWYPTLTTLPNGDVLALSGEHAGEVQHDTEIFNVGRGIWTNLGRPTLGGMNRADWVYPSWYPRMHVIPAPLHLGPGYNVLASNGPNFETALFDPTRNDWQVLTPSAQGRWGTREGFDFQSVLLPLAPHAAYQPSILRCDENGIATRLTLSASGVQWQPTNSRPPNPSTPESAAAPARFHGVMTLLPTGEVLFSGGMKDFRAHGTGSDAESSVFHAEIYSPATDSWRLAERASVPRNYHSVALLMPNGAVWTAGSNTLGDYSYSSYEGRTPGFETRIEIYEPWYFERPRPVVTLRLRPGARHAVARHGQGLRVGVSGPRAASFALLRCGSCTHAFDGDQRWVGLVARSVGTGEMEVFMPPNGEIAPPGMYMLFALGEDLAPSIGQFVELRPAFGTTPLRRVWMEERLVPPPRIATSPFGGEPPPGPDWRLALLEARVDALLELQARHAGHEADDLDTLDHLAEREREIALARASSVRTRTPAQIAALQATIRREHDRDATSACATCGASGGTHDHPTAAHLHDDSPGAHHPADPGSAAEGSTSPPTPHDHQGD